MNELLLPATTAELSPIQKGWLQMCNLREVTFTELQKGELQIQSLLKDHASEKNLEAIQEKIKSAKAVFEEHKERRLFFTNILKERIIEPSMEFEKRSEALIKEASQTEFTLRKTAADAAQLTQNKLAEEARFVAHVKNEFSRIATEYRGLLKRRIAFYYTGALQQKKMNKKELEEYKENIRLELPQIEVPLPEKFQPILLGVERMMELYKNIPKYSNVEELQNAVNSVEEAFAMYDSDIKNSEKAIVAVQQQQQAQESQEQQALAQEQATNSLIASADNIEIVGAPVVKKKRAIVEENTQAFALAVMTAFIQNISKVKLRTKEWGNVKVSQMATALNALDKEFPGLQYKDIES